MTDFPLHPTGVNPILTAKWETDVTIELWAWVKSCQEHSQREIAWGIRFDDVASEAVPSPSQTRDLLRLCDAAFQTVMCLAINKGLIDKIEYVLPLSLPDDSMVSIKSTLAERQVGRCGIGVKYDGHWQEDWTTSPTVEELQCALSLLGGLNENIKQKYGKLGVVDPRIVA